MAAANPNTIVVLETGGPVTMPWAQHVKGIVEMWYPGIGGAQALANILFGEVNPSGKLAVTFAKSDAQLPHPIVPGLEARQPATRRTTRPAPSISTTPKEPEVGYKWFEANHKQPLFPFGFGLSYTTFAYSGLTVDDATRTVTLHRHQHRPREGTEIAELYVTLPPAANENYQAPRSMAARHARSRRIEDRHPAPCNPLYLSVFDTTKNAWQLLPGDYKVMAGPSSNETPLNATLHVQP